MKFPGNMGELFSQVQKLQENMSQVQEDLAKREIEASAGGGMAELEGHGVNGVPAARRNIEAYVDAVLTLLGRPAVTEREDAYRRAG